MSGKKHFLFRFIGGLSMAALGGYAFVLAFPPYEIWPLAFIGFIPVLIAQHRVMPEKFSSLASGLGIAVWLQGYLGPVFAPIGTYMVWLPLFAFLISAVIDQGQRIFHGQTAYRWFVINGIITWAGIEMIRLFLPIAGTWGFIAYPLYRQLWLIQPASIFGIIGTGMLVMLVNYVLALLIINRIDARWPALGALQGKTASIPEDKLVHRWLTLGSLVLAGWLVLSIILYNIPLQTPTVKVGAIQPAVSPIISINRGEDMSDLYNRMLEQTDDAANAGARFIVWPEGAFNWDPQDNDQLNLRSKALQSGAYLVTGYLVVVDDEGFRNEATVINPNGEFLGVFGKDHPVVFGGETSLSQGSYPVYNTDIGRLATIICYDLDYTDTTRKMVRQGAQLIGVPSNDWGSIADKHYTHVVFRAIENRVAMVKADGGYNSAIIDPHGAIIDLAVFPEGGEATLVADVKIGSGRGTVNTYLGDWIGWLSLVGILFFTFGSRWLVEKCKTH
jgi:apolipoprotein N-acyltransferase